VNKKLVAFSAAKLNGGNALLQCQKAQQQQSINTTAGWQCS
jgi:hypothetical protein